MARLHSLVDGAVRGGVPIAVCFQTLQIVVQGFESAVSGVFECHWRFPRRTLPSTLAGESIGAVGTWVHHGFTPSPPGYHSFLKVAC